MNLILPELKHSNLDRFNCQILHWINGRDDIFNVMPNETNIFTGKQYKLYDLLPISDSNSNLLRLDREAMELVNNSFDVFHYSVPNVKLYYPEPFIASPTFIHEDIWFLHIAIYQYWLWFFFMSTIIFFFLVYLITIRWCNMRFRPGRETRGVSRSKCGDLITATVPVSWATSIIIHESTDAIELNDGFGSTEMAIGIRAYQWGWEYYYPKDMNLNFKNNTNNFFMGNSLKYSSASSRSQLKGPHKVNLYSSDFLSTSKTPTSFILLSNWNNATVNSFQNLNFGNNKLVARRATNLITSPRVLNLNSLLKNKIFTKNTPKLFYNYKQYIYENRVYPKPLFSYNQTTNINSNMLFNLSANYSNLHNVKQVLDHSYSGNSWGINKFWYWSFRVETLWRLWNLKNIQLNLISEDFYASNSYLLGFKLPSKQIVGQSTSPSMDNLTTFGSQVQFNEYANYKLFNELKNTFVLWNSSWYMSSIFAEQDFKRWSAQELLEDTYWSNSLLTPNLLNVFGDVKSSLQISDNPASATWNIKQNDDCLPACETFNNNTPFFKDYSYTDSFYSMPTSVNTSFVALNSTNLSLVNILVNKNWVEDLLTNNFYIFKLNLRLNLFFHNNFLYVSNYNFRFFSIYDLLSYYSLFINTPVKTSETSDLVHSNCFNFFNNWDFSNTLKNLSTFSQAFWKVFRSALDEQRSTFNFYKFSTTAAELPFLNQQFPSLLGSLQKNNTSFYNLTGFKLIPKYTLNNIILDNVWNSFTFSFPFTISFESDIIRYSWFDWYSTRNSIITKALDTSVFGLHGAKNYNYTFTTNPNIAFLNRVDNFFMKYSNARKLYTQSFIYTPYYYTKFKNWFIWDNFFELINRKADLNAFNRLLSTTDSFFNYSVGTYYDRFTANFSNTSSVLRNYFTTVSVSANYTDVLSQLFDILSKREYLFRKWILNTTSSINLTPQFYNATNSNPIVLDIKFSLKNYINDIHNNGSSVFSTHRFLKDYTTYSNYIENKHKNLYVKKNPYQPMRKGISNMIRIQADKAVAMPTDTRLQILAVSRDIIHSWAIPSAGIKIDCIPGYSSHRVAVFVLSGIYWGQCMEICGRFHHWMPIVVYFMRRDLFFMWCVHFIFKNKQMNSITQSFDLQSTNSSDFVSYTPYNWIYEL